MYRTLTQILGCIVAVTTLVGCGSGHSGAPAKSKSESASAASPASSPEAGKLIAYPPIPVVTKADATAKDLLVNGGFEKPLEEEPRAWVVKPDGVALSPEQDIVAEGKRAMRFEPGDAKNMAVTQMFKVPAQSRYELQGLALAQNVNGTVKLVARDASGNRFSAESGSAPGNNGAWSPLTLTIVVPAFVKELTLGLEYVAAAQKIYDGPSALALDRFKLIDRGAPINMLKNGDFTQGVNGDMFWNHPETLVVSQEDSGLIADTPKCLRVDLPGNYNLGINQHVGGLTPGLAYTCRGYIKTQNVAGETCLELHHGEKGFQGFMKRTQTVPGAADWTWVDVTFTAPADMSSVTVLLRRPADASSPETPGTIWFARCELFPADAG